MPITSVPATEKTQPRWRKWLRWFLIALVAGILITELVLVWPHLAPAWDRIGDIRWEWVLASFVAAMLSMDSYAQVQRVLFRSAGVKVKQRESLAVILASNSISQTMPGGQVLSPAFVYRETRKWGATPVVASWQLVMSGLLAGFGLGVLGLGGALLAGAQKSPFSIIFSIAGLIIFVIAVQFLSGHPEIIEGLGQRMLTWVNHLRGKPEDHGKEALHRVLGQLRAVKLRPRDGAEAFGWSMFNWVADVACLGFACYAIGAHPSITGLMVAYAAGKAVGTAMPLLPGGIGVVDAMLVPALTSAGMPFSDALIAVVIYRLISYVIVSIVGWVVIAVRFRSEIKERGELTEQMDEEEAELRS
ncbi:MAG: YbhN family protein [Gordonia sp. (in: high G+C Gram-positive bacteria)]|uniref:lysylphosphatidylglycerol synthase transmembrane domain-containing protein n=1 Tax=Gordonia sp. (in: high G+C Gram-positive bacteria) TaxID=84139 RepID=UPI0039E5E986